MHGMLGERLGKSELPKDIGGSARHAAFASKSSNARKSEQFTHRSVKGKTYVN